MESATKDHLPGMVRPMFMSLICLKRSCDQSSFEHFIAIPSCLGEYYETAQMEDKDYFSRFHQVTIAQQL